jgi:hypothetical protein
MSAVVIAGVVFVASTLSLVLSLLAIECVAIVRERRARSAKDEVIGDYPFVDPRHHGRKP